MVVQFVSWRPTEDIMEYSWNIHIIHGIFLGCRQLRSHFHQFSGMELGKLGRNRTGIPWIESVWGPTWTQFFGGSAVIWWGAEDPGTNRNLLPVNVDDFTIFLFFHRGFPVRCRWSEGTRGCPSSLAKLVQVTPITMVYGRYGRYIYTYYHIHHIYN